VPTANGSSTPLSARGATLLVVLTLALLLGLYRRGYQPSGSFLDVLLGKRTAAAVEQGSVSPVFARVWRIVVWGGALGLGWYGAARQLPSGMPPGIVLYGIVIGAVTGVLALGVILVYRTNRVINFAQAAFGSVALVLTFELTYQWHLPYFVSAFVGIACAAGLAGGAELGVMRRFREAPRLIVTLGTIGLANVFLFLQVIIVVLFERNAEKTALGSVFYPSPLNHPVFRLSGVVFTGDVVLAMLVVPVVLIFLVRFLQGSWLGMGLRASAENADRASTLAVPVGRLSTLSWVIAGALSAIATLLRAPITGYSLSSASTTGFLAILLTAVVLGKLENLKLCFVGAIAIGVVDQVYFYNYGRGSHLDTIHLIWILGALLLYTKPRGRAVWNELSSWKAFREVRPIAPELARVPLVRFGRLAVPALAFGLIALFPLVVHGFAAIRLATLIGIWAIAALSLVVLTGWGGHISLGQWSIVGVGAFVAGRILSWHQQPSIVVVLVAASAAGGIVAAALGIPAFRLRGIYLAVITFAFAAAAYSLLFTVGWLVPSGPIVRPPALRTERSVFYLVLALLVVCVAALRNIRRSRLGRILVAARDNEVAVMSYGVNLLRARAASFILSGGIAGLAGGLYATMNTSVRYQDFGPELSLQLFAIAVIGGLGSLSGALVGALYIVGAAYFLPSYGPFLATGLGMLFFLLVFPGGLGQIVYGVRDAVLRRLARRLEIDSPTLTADRRSAGTEHIGELLVADGVDLR
jgi:branched-chain amino acid transport system permease protein